MSLSVVELCNSAGCLEAHSMWGGTEIKEQNAWFSRAIKSHQLLHIDMVVARDTHRRLHDGLLHGLSLSQAHFAASAAQLHACAATVVLTLEAAKIAHSRTSSSSRAYEDNVLANKTRLAALAVFHKLSSLPNGVPITLLSLHDFVIVFTSPESHASAKEASLAR